MLNHGTSSARFNHPGKVLTWLRQSSQGVLAEGFPEAGESTATYAPPPMEDNNIEGGIDDQGLAPEIEVNIEEEVEDLNADLVTTDRQSDIPEPTAPSWAVAIDAHGAGDPADDIETELDVLTIVPSTQPPSPRTPPRRVARCPAGTRDDGFRRPVQPLTPVPESTTQGATRGRGRGILRLPAPPKLARTPASRRRPSVCGTLLPPTQWAIQVSETPVVEYRALTPTGLESVPDPGNHLPLTPEAFQDVDYRPLTGSWADIVAREEQEQAAAAAAAMATLVVPPNMPTLVQPTTAPTPMLTTAPTMLTATAKPLLTVVATTSSQSTVSGGITSQIPIPVPVTLATVDTPEVSSADVVGTEGGPVEPPPTTSASQTDRRPVLRLADVAYAVRVTQAGQADHIADTLLRRFQTTHSRGQLLLIIQSMSAMLYDVGSFLRERVVYAQLSDEPLQEVLDNITRLLAHYMSGDASQRPA